PSRAAAAYCGFRRGRRGGGGPSRDRRAQRRPPGPCAEGDRLMTSDAGNSEQLRFWRGEFGNDYTDRNTHGAAELRARVALWAQILRHIEGAPPESILEVGA